MTEISESVSVVYEAFGENPRESCKEKRLHAHDCVDSRFFSLEIPNKEQKFGFSRNLTMFRGFVLVFIHASDCVLLQIYTTKNSKLVFGLCL